MYEEIRYRNNAKMKYARSTSQGFTIIELAVVVLLIGILALVAIPSYQNYEKKVQKLEPLALTSPVMVDGIERQLTEIGRASCRERV